MSDVHAQEHAIAAVQTARPATPARHLEPAPRRPARTRRAAAAAALPAVLLSLALGVWGIRRGGAMWRDEAVTYDMANRGVGDLWQTLGTADAVHGLYYLLMKGLFTLCSLFGDIDPLLVLRLPSVLATAATTAGVALIGRRLQGPRAGLLAGAAFAAQPPVQRFAQEGRSYAMVCALVVWATYALVRAAEAPRPRFWAGYAPLMLAACLLHEFAVFALPAHAVAVGRGARRQWAAAAAAVVVAVTPLALFSRRQSAQVDWLEVNTDAYTGAVRLCVIGLACATFLVWGAPARARESTRDPWESTRLPRLAFALLAAPTLLLMLLAVVKPLYVDRYVLYCLAGFALLVGAALDRAARARGWRAAVAGAVAAVAVVVQVPAMAELRTPAGRSDDVSAVARAMHALGSDGDAVLYLPHWRRVSTLPHPWAADGLRDVALDRSPSASHTLYGSEVPAATLRARVRAQDRVLAVGDPTGAPADPAALAAAKRDVLGDGFEACRSWRSSHARVTLYARPGHC